MMDGISQPRSMHTGSQGMSNFVVLHADALNLTADQKSEIAAIQVAHQQNMRANRQSMQKQSGRQNNRNQLNQGRHIDNQPVMQRANRIEDRMELHSELISILTEDQKSQLKEIRKEQVRNRNEFRTLTMTTALESLELSSEKHAKVSQILTAHTATMLAQRLAEIEANFERGEMGPQRDRDEQWERRDNMHNELKEILTVNEYEKLIASISPRANYAMMQSDRRRGMNRNR